MIDYHAALDYYVYHMAEGKFMSERLAPLDVISRQSEIIICYREPHHGVWVQYTPEGPCTAQDMRAHRTALEMAVGNAKVIYNSMGEERYNNAEPLKVKIADDAKWHFLMGLVVCGLAERIQIT